MRIDTPQILWHNGSEGNGKAAPLYSVSFLPYTPSTDRVDVDGTTRTTNITSNGRVGSSTNPIPVSSNTNTNNNNNTVVELLATAGNTNEINLWKLSFPTTTKPITTPLTTQKKANILQTTKTPHPSITISHHLTLTRHERSINAVSFSPYGTHLATAGDGGSLLLYSIPHAHRSKHNQQNKNHTFWTSHLHTESDLLVKLIPTHSEDILSLSWSADERHLILGTLDHSLLLIEANVTNTQSQTGVATVTEEWTVVFRNNREHTQYVQGVSFDPMGVYLGSQGSDRTVRVWMRDRGVGKGGKKKKVLAVVDRNVGDGGNGGSGNGEVQGENWREGAFDVLPKPKVLKYRIERHTVVKKVATEPTTTTNPPTDSTAMSDGGAVVVPESPGGGGGDKTTTVVAQKKHHLFADESTVESFFRRLAWTVDGAFLITPASIWQGSGGGVAAPSFAVYLFARHHFDRPYKVLSGLDKPAVVIRPNPVLFQLPQDAQDNSKENIPSQSPPSTTSPHATHINPSSTTTSPLPNNNNTLLPYRSIFAVLTLDTILIYDTYHTRPLCIARELHYAGLTDCTWSSDGRNLTVCSTDGYISILSFDKGELGEVYIKPATMEREEVRNGGGGVVASSVVVGKMGNLPLGNVVGNESVRYTPPALAPVPSDARTAIEGIVLPPCEAGQSVQIVAPPTKKARIVVGSGGGDSMEKEKRRIKPMLIPTSGVSPNRAFATTPPPSLTALATEEAMEEDGTTTDHPINRGIKRDIDASQVGRKSPGGITAEGDVVVLDLLTTEDEEDEEEEEEGDDGDSCSMVDREVLGAVTNLSLQQKQQKQQHQQQEQQNRGNTLAPLRKKKRIQPTLLRGN